MRVVQSDRADEAFPHGQLPPVKTLPTLAGGHPVKIRKEQLRSFAALSLESGLRSRGLQTERDDSHGELLVANAKGATTRIALDAEGRVARETTPRRRSFLYGYDDAGRLTRFERPEGGSLGFSYDGEGRLEGLTRGDRTWRLDRDESGEVSNLRFPDGTDIGIESSGPGRIDSWRTRGGRLVRFDHGEVGRVASITDPRGHVTSYRYDPLGRPEAVSYPDGTEESFVRDGAGRLRGASTIATT